MSIEDNTDLTVAVTGPTGTFGHGLIPLLQNDNRVSRIVGIARRPFDPQAEGWSKLEYRQGDVRDEEALKEAFDGADVVVHLAFMVLGGGAGARETNIEGTLNAFRAASAVGARRFVYSSSVSAYGFHPDNPSELSEEWPVRPAEHLAYAQEKAELEALLTAEAEPHPALALYMLRPPIVLGPHAVGAKAALPGPLAPLNKYLEAGLRRLPVPVPALVPDLRVQFVHEEDVGRALLQCVIGAGPAGAYNIAGDGVLSTLDVAREFGLLPLPAPTRPVKALAGLVAKVPGVPRAGWAEVIANPPVMDTTKAKKQLGWKPKYTGREALQATLGS